MPVNRVCIVFGTSGDIVDIVADESVKIILVDQSIPRERVFLYEAVKIGREHVEKHIRGLPFGRWPPTSPE
jgi:hypothetical protein